MSVTTTTIGWVVYAISPTSRWIESEEGEIYRTEDRAMEFAAKLTEALPAGSALKYGVGRVEG